LAELSVIVPARNDAETLPHVMRDLDRVVAQASIFAEVIVIDDASEDATLAVLEELAEEYANLHVRIFTRDLVRPSFGGLVRFGMAHAAGRYCAIVSADATDPVDLLPEMLRRLRGGATMVVVSRYMRPEDARRVGPVYRLYQLVYRTAIKLLLGREVADSTYGFRAFNRQYIQALGTSSNRFNIFPEMTFKVLASGGTIDYLAGAPQPVGVGGSEKFKLPNEILGYAAVLARAALHRANLVRWF
jgi:glycosyltransferase involved in cell wall biosynthesis